MSHRFPGGEKFKVNKNLNRDGISCSCSVYSFDFLIHHKFLTYIF